MTVPATSNGNDVGATCASSCVVDSVTAVLLAAPADGIATEMYCSRCCVKSHSGSNPCESKKKNRHSHTLGQLSVHQQHSLKN
jgi:hypothetical protein